MDNLPQEQSNIQGQNNYSLSPAPTIKDKSSNVKWLLIAALFILALLIVVGISVWLISQQSATQEDNDLSASRKPIVTTQQEEPISRPVGKYSLLYQYIEDYKGADSIQKLFKSDIEGKNKIEIESGIIKELKFYSDGSYFISKNGKYIGRESRNVEIASAESFPSSKDITKEFEGEKGTLGGILWSEDGRKLLFSLYPQIGKEGLNTEQVLDSVEVEYYIVERDGTNKQLIPLRLKDTVYGNHSVLDFNVSKNELYVLYQTEDSFSATDSRIEDDLKIIDLSTGKVKNTFKLPETVGLASRFSTDFRRFYYVSEGKLIEHDLIAQKEKTVHEENLSGRIIQLPYFAFTPPKDHSMFLIIRDDTRDPNYRAIKLFNPSNGEIEILFEASDPKFKGMEIEEKSISPNTRFVWIKTNEGFYILDVPNKKLSKFLQKQEFPKGQVTFIGWLVE